MKRQTGPYPKDGTEFLASIGCPTKHYHFTVLYWDNQENCFCYAHDSKPITLGHQILAWYELPEEPIMMMSVAF